MGVDEAGRDEAALGVDLLIHRLRICFAHVLNPIAVEYDDTVFDNFVLLAVEADDVTALYKGFHCLAFQILNSNRGRTNKRSYSRQAFRIVFHDAGLDTVAGTRYRAGTDSSLPQSSLRKPLFSKLLTKVLS